MAEERAMAEVLEMLEVEAPSAPAGGIVSVNPASGPDILSLREQLAVLVSTGKAKEAIGVQLTQEQVKRLTDHDKEVEKYFKRYETYVGSKTTGSLIDSFIYLRPKPWCCFSTSKTLNLTKKSSERTTSSLKSSQT